MVVRCLGQRRYSLDGFLKQFGHGHAIGQQAIRPGSFGLSAKLTATISKRLHHSDLHVCV
jgi:hypothetical protein